MLSLKNWYLKLNAIGMFLSGDVFGHYRLEDGDFINTSTIKEVYLLEKKKYVFETYSGSCYQLAEEDMDKEHLEQTKAFMEKIEIIQSETLSEKIEKGNALLEKKRKIREKALENAMTWSQKYMKNQELYLIVDGIKILKAVVKYEDSVYEIEPSVHVGMIQDSVLICDMEHGNVDFRYFPRNRIETYRWSKNLECIYLHNIGDGYILFNGFSDSIDCEKNQITKIERDKYGKEISSTLELIYPRRSQWN